MRIIIELGFKLLSISLISCIRYLRIISSIGFNLSLGMSKITMLSLITLGVLYNGGTDSSFVLLDSRISWISRSIVISYWFLLGDIDI
jgi:hypothetical protein